MTTGIYQTIANRFRGYTIHIEDHIQKILKVGYTVGEGFSFTPKDHRHLIYALKRTKKFHPDDRRDFFGAAAASQTEGDGWREEGLTSLHCAIAPAVCSVHIDSIGFVLSGPGGKYSPDLFQHILHDLGWWKIVTAAYGKSSLLGDVLSRVHPHVFNSADKYRTVGIGVAPLDVKDSKGEDRYKLTIDFSEACTGSRLCEKHGPMLSVDFTAHVDWENILKLRKK